MDRLRANGVVNTQKIDTWCVSMRDIGLDRAMEKAADGATSTKRSHLRCQIGHAAQRIQPFVADDRISASCERSNIETETEYSAKASCPSASALNKVGYNLCKANGGVDACNRDLAGRTWS